MFDPSGRLMAELSPLADATRITLVSVTRDTIPSNVAAVLANWSARRSMLAICSCIRSAEAATVSSSSVLASTTTATPWTARPTSSAVADISSAVAETGRLSIQRSCVSSSSLSAARAICLGSM